MNGRRKRKTLGLLLNVYLTEHISREPDAILINKIARNGRFGIKINLKVNSYVKFTTIVVGLSIAILW